MSSSSESKKESSRVFHIVLWGATGYTGRLTAEYLAKHCPEDVEWAIAGRTKGKLEALRDSLAEGKQKSNIGVITASLDNYQSVLAMAQRAEVLVSAVGPYTIHGEAAVRACIEAGIDYCDVTGEVYFVQRMIKKYGAVARNKGVKIISFCGFDSVPSDMGVLHAANAWRARAQQLTTGDSNEEDSKEDSKEGSGGVTKDGAGLYPNRVVSTVTAEGGVSGGTLATMRNIMSLPFGEIRAMSHPYYLNTDPQASLKQATELSKSKNLAQRVTVPSMPYGLITRRSEEVEGYEYPFIMASCNMKVVQRSINLITSQPKQFVPVTEKKEQSDELQAANMTEGPYRPLMTYEEKCVADAWWKALLWKVMLLLFSLLMMVSLTRWVVSKFMPKQGKGPSRKSLEKGFTDFAFIASGHTPNGKLSVRTRVHSKLSPYLLTACTVAECALALILHDHELPEIYGFVTPSSAVGPVLLSRLQAAGVKFDVVTGKETQKFK